jgi:hypothetical protein
LEEEVEKAPKHLNPSPKSTSAQDAWGEASSPSLEHAPFPAGFPSGDMD